MSRLEEILKNHEISFHYEDHYFIGYDKDDDFINDLKSYANECVKASLEKASKNASAVLIENKAGIVIPYVSKGLITNPDNIVML